MTRMSQRKGFTLIELLVVIAIIAILIGLLLPAVQKVRESAARATCQNNIKQMGLAAHSFESANSRLPEPGQCDSTGGASTRYMIHSWNTLILPYIEQDNVYRAFDVTSNPFTLAGYTTTTLHPKARGRSYNDADPVNNAARAAAKTTIKTFICPSTPVGAEGRDTNGYGGVDYMVISVTDIEDGRPGAAETLGARPSAARRSITSDQGCLSCDGRTVIGITDGSSNTILFIEDAGRVDPRLTGSPYRGNSTRSLPVASAAGEDISVTGGPANARRVHAWVDADATGNGYSGPSNSTGDRTARFNNNANPTGGPTTCAWSINNCGPNDEPFSFHSGVVNAAMGDGSVRSFRDSTSWQVSRALATSSGGEVITE